MLDNESLVYRREDAVDGLSGWIWISHDYGSWDGPKMDWEKSHKAVLLKHVKKFKVVAQAGGNLGMYPCLLSNMFEYVYTWEPDPLNFFCLAQNCQKDNIIKFQGAVGDKHQMIQIARHTMENTGMHAITVGDGTGVVPMFKIDDIKFHDLDLIWLDIEGQESAAIAGALESINKFRPVIMAERPNDQILSLLAPYGYEKVDQSVSDGIYLPHGIL